MKKSKFVMIVVTALLVLSFMAGPVQAQDEPPAWDGELPDISEMTPRYDEGFPPEPITVDASAEPVAPIDELVYSRLPKLYFNRDIYATQYRVEIHDLMTGFTQTTKGPGTCDSWYCYLQPPTKLSKYNLPTTGGLFLWRVQEKAFGSWQSWSPYKYFVVMSKGFTSTFDSDKVNWKDLYGTWTLTSKGYLKTFGINNRYASVLYREAFMNFDYQVTMKRKTDVMSPNGVIIKGIPDQVGGIFQWDDGIYFVYANFHDFTVYKYVNGTLMTIQEWTQHAAVKPFDWNTLRVVGTYPYLDFWINGTYLGWITDPLSGYWVGITMYTNDLNPPLLVDEAVLVADRSVTAMAHDPAMQLGLDPVDPDEPIIREAGEDDPTGTR